MANKPKNALKLVSMIGLPALCAAGLLGYGVHLGDRHRDQVLAFEQRFLGMDVPADVGRGRGQPSSEATARPLQPTLRGVAAPPNLPAEAPRAYEAELDARGLLPVDAGVAAGASAAGSDGAVAALPSLPAAAPPPDSLPTFAAPPQVAAQPRAANPAAPADPSSLSVAVRVKVLVDERFARAEPQWLSVVQQTVAEASRAYQQRVGIDLVLVGMVRWPRALDGLSTSAMLADLRTRPREGADILVGVLAAPLEPAARGQGAPPPTGPLNGAYAVVGWQNEELPHLRGMLWSVGRLLGALALTPGAGDDFSLGSWMGDGPPPADGRLWLDLENIQRIHARRGRPFEPPPASASRGSAAGQAGRR